MENLGTPPPLMKGFFGNQNFSETLSGSSAKISVLGGKNVRWKNLILPPLVCKNFLDTKKFLKHRRVPLRIVSVL